ncbi:MAG TPA: ADOP family duplicated permease [Vicinamibacterales bacterium]|nr:ADOP family duplicated permease [Vicinamibacterales bacterium]
MFLEHFSYDLRHAWRGLSRARAFSGAAIFMLALAVFGTTVIFTFIRGVLLRPLPVRDQDRLIVAWKELRSTGYAHYPFGDAEIEAAGAASRLIESVAGVDSNGAFRWILDEDGESAYVMGALVTGGFFEVLGVEPLLGRAFTRADDKTGAEDVLVISHGLWQRRYGGSPDAIGRRVTLSERPFIIAGVMPPDVDYPAGTEVWRTTRSVPIVEPFGDAAQREVDLIARLRPGVTIQQAASELTALARQYESAATRPVTRGLVLVVRSLEDVVVGNVRPVLIALLAAVVLVLLIASSNVANLVLMRGEARRGELAVRQALGAGRGRLARQLILESVLLSTAAAAAGLALTWWSLDALVTLVPDGLPRVESVRVDVAVVLFTVGVALVTSMLAGVAPAMWSVRTNLSSDLRTGGRGAAGTAARRERRGLVVAQVALAVSVVAAAGLVTRSVLRLQSVEVGLAVDRLVFVELSLPFSRYVERGRQAQFLNDVLERLEAAPAIASATAINVLPFSGGGGWDVPRFTAEGQSADRAAINPSLNLESVHHTYFETFEVPIVRGRGFTAADRAGGLDVAIVSEDVAARTWPGEDAIGKRMKMGGPDSRDPWRTVVGVAAPTRYRELARQRATLYLPSAQFILTAQPLVLRTTAPLDLTASVARDAVRAVDPSVQVMRVSPFERLLDGPLARPKFNARLLGVFGVTALLLAAIGLAAVMTAQVRQREREIAVRVALGATPAGICRLVLGEALWLAGLGAAIGLAGAAAATRVVRSLLFEIDALDPLSLAGAAMLLMIAAALAAGGPARHATRLDAAQLLR